MAALLDILLKWQSSACLEAYSRANQHLWCPLQSTQAPTGAITWLDREAPEPTAGMITHAGPKSDDPLWRD